MLLENFHYCLVEHKFIYDSHCEWCFPVHIEMPSYYLPTNYRNNIWLPINNGLYDRENIHYSFDGEGWILWQHEPFKLFSTEKVEWFSTISSIVQLIIASKVPYIAHDAAN